MRVAEAEVVTAMVDDAVGGCTRREVAVVAGMTRVIVASHGGCDDGGVSCGWS